uniref:Uncharacterized protein n=1 Tax=Theropithecus gelada TaxID=9565 RepID=A0A8D2E992_THEGE
IMFDGPEQIEPEEGKTGSRLCQYYLSETQELKNSSQFCSCCRNRAPV